MNENRRRILEMLAAGKITAQEAERLFQALGEEEKREGHASGFAGAADTASGGAKKAKYMRVQVEADQAHNGKGPVKVDLRIPVKLLHAGVRFSSLIPQQAREQVNNAFRHKGIDFDINQLKPENLSEIVDQLNDLTVDVDQEGAKVRVFCE